MLCPYCGTPINPGARFCRGCGAPVTETPAQAQEPAPPERDPDLPEGIVRDENGAYHWTYRMNMRKNPTVLITLLKVFGGIFGGLALIMSLVLVIQGDADEVPQLLLVMAAICAGLCILSAIVWLCMAAARGGWYIIEHSMDEERVVYLSTPEEKRKTRGLAVAGFLLALASDDLTLAGSSMALSASERFDSVYTSVKSIQAVPRRDLIKVNNTLQRNTIYAAPHQYDFVWRYITAHCPNARIK